MWNTPAHIRFQAVLLMSKCPKNKLITVIGMSIRTNLSIALTPPILTLTLTLTLTLNACLVDLLPLWQWIINLTHTPLPYPLIYP